MESNFLEKDYSKINKNCASQTDVVLFVQAWNIQDLEGHGVYNKDSISTIDHLKRT